MLQDQSSSSFSFGHDLIRHNLVVFRGGEGSLQVLPSLVDVIPEARLNLVIYYLKQVEVLSYFEINFYSIWSTLFFLYVLT